MRPFPRRENVPVSAAYERVNLKQRDYGDDISNTHDGSMSAKMVRAAILSLPADARAACSSAAAMRHRITPFMSATSRHLRHAATRMRELKA